MKGFQVITKDHGVIRFRYYYNEAPVTVKAFDAMLPFARIFLHARVSGQEVWIDDMPDVDIIQENASVFTETGEVVLGPSKASRAKTAGCLGIYYGEGKGLDCCNIFAKVIDEDLVKLKALGEQIWKEGKQVLNFQKANNES